MKTPTRKFVIAIVTVILTVGLVGTGALAYFQDTETSTGNTFTAGTLDLKLADYDEDADMGPDDGVTATWTMTNMAPGVTSTTSWDVDLSNSGTIAGNHVEIAFSHAIDEGIAIESETNSNNTPEEMAQWLEILDISYTGVNFDTSPGHVLVDTNGNSFLDLDDLADPANAAALDNLLVPPAGHGHTSLDMDIKFNSGAGNDFQGDTLITTVTLTLNQDVSQ
jgi:spore coat-associated protein N